MGKCIKGEEVDSEGDGGREDRLFINDHPVGVMVIGHEVLLKSTTP
jgi:hypothetical protein